MHITSPDIKHDDGVCEHKKKHERASVKEDLDDDTSMFYHRDRSFCRAGFGHKKA